MQFPNSFCISSPIFSIYGVFEWKKIMSWAIRKKKQTIKFLDHEYQEPRLKSTLCKFYGRYNDFLRIFLAEEFKTRQILMSQIISLTTELCLGKFKTRRKLYRANIILFSIHFNYKIEYFLLSYNRVLFKCQTKISTVLKLPWSFNQLNLP